MPEPEVLRASMRGVKVELHTQQWNLFRHNQAKKRGFLEKGFYQRGAEIAVKINKLQKIVEHLEIMETVSKYQKLRKAA